MFRTEMLWEIAKMTPEEEARQLIDELLEAADWQVQDYKQVNLGASLVSGTYESISGNPERAR